MDYGTVAGLAALLHASTSEAIQLVLSAVSLGLNGWALRDAHTDAYELDDAFRKFEAKLLIGQRAIPAEESYQHMLRRLIALGHVKRELSRCVKQLVLLFIGVVSVVLPPPYPYGMLAGESQQLVITRVALAVLSGWMVLDALRERHQRRKIIRATRNRPAPRTPERRTGEIW